MRQISLIMGVVGLLAGCGGNWPGPGAGDQRTQGAAPEVLSAPEDAVRPRARPGGGVPPAAGARTADTLDTTTEAEKDAAKSAAGGRDLGVTVASLGAVAEPGFWLKTPLVSAPMRGRVEYAATGQSVQVDLIPIDGPKSAGSRVSLAAMRLLEAPLTGLPELRVYRLSR